MSWFDKVPKIELHLHLEGAIPVASLWELIEKHGGDPSVPSLEALERKFVFRDFEHFIDVWVWKNQFLKDYEDFVFVAQETALSLQAQNVVYAEMFFSPGDYARAGLTTQGLAEAIREGISKAGTPQVNLIVDLVRDFGPERAMRTLHEAAEVRNFGIIGVGIGGSEQLFPPEPFREVYTKARNMGFRTTAHAGEVMGADSIWGVIKSLNVDRIGHGTRASEDPNLIDYLAEHRIPLEMCPLSNVRTGVVPSVAAHPIKDFFQRGLLLTVNADDPTMFGNSLAMEYRALAKELAFSNDEIRQLITNGVESSWLTEGEKEAITSRIKEDENWDP
jgi:adenosine deaminase